MRKVMYENDEIKIDNGLFFGKGVFETILVNKKPVFLEEHVKRLNNAIEALNIGEKIEIEEVRSFIIKNKINYSHLQLLNPHLLQVLLVHLLLQHKYHSYQYELH